MGVHKIKRGLDLPLLGGPEQRIDEAPRPSRVALLAADYVGLRPTMHVVVGDGVRRGQRLFEDKKMPGVVHTSLGAGKVVAINRGEKRAFQSVVVELDAAEGAGGADQVSFAAYTGKPPASLSRDEVRELLVESGLWTALRARPYGRVANPETTPRSLFVTAMNSHPQAPHADVVMAGREEDFEGGLRVLARLTDGPVYVCKGKGSAVQAPAEAPFQVAEFQGPHPAGTAGLHIHLLDPVDRHKLVWYLGYQDVMAVGRLFATGTLDVERVVALAGPSVHKPRLLRTRLGASIDALVASELREGENRVLSGSVLSGRGAAGEVVGFLGRYHEQVSVLAEDRKREFLGWLRPGAKKFSTVGAFLSRFLPRRSFAMTTSTQGSPRAIVPIGMYERVMPMDLMATFLLKALVMEDVEQAEELGCLELVEEDLALCTFVCPGKIEYGPHLRNVLTILEREG